MAADRQGRWDADDSARSGLEAGRVSAGQRIPAQLRPFLGDAPGRGAEVELHGSEGALVLSKRQTVWIYVTVSKL